MPKNPKIYLIQGKTNEADDARKEIKAGGHHLFVKMAPPKRALCSKNRQIIRICAGVQQQEPTALSQ